MKNHYYPTVSEATADLNKRGYTVDLEIMVDEGCLVCHSPSLSLPPEAFEIDEIHRFEGNTDPGDEMIVYAISSKEHEVKGIVVNAYGMYADPATFKIVERLKRKE